MFPITDTSFVDGPLSDWIYDRCMDVCAVSIFNIFIRIQYGVKV